MPATIEATELQLLDVFSDKYIFNIPPYQRPYAWTTEQTGELLDDLLYAMGRIEQMNEAPPYFLGSIVIIKKKKEDPSAEVIDGQQRLTTLTILLCVLREFSDDKIKRDLDEFIWQEGSEIKGTEDVFRVTLRERDKHFFQENVQKSGQLRNFVKKDTTKRPDSQQRMFENAKHLWQELQDLNSKQRDRLAQFISQRCYLVVVSTSDQSSAYRIFAVMNDRGLDLSPTDILKAEIIGDMPESIRSKYTEAWEDIEEDIGRDNFRDLFAHIRMIYMKDKARGELSEEFRDGVISRLKNKNFIDDELTPFADAYKKVTRADYKNEDGTSAEEVKLSLYLKHLRRLDNSDWIPPAMAFFNSGPNNNDALKFVRRLERLAYGMFILRVNINGRIKRYARVLRAIETGNDEELFGEALQLSPEEKGKILRVLDGPIYSLPRVPMPLLLRLDSLLAGAGARYDYPTISIEHVLPQSPSPNSKWVTRFPDEEEREQWTHRLGNLVLLSRRKNSQAQNYDFERKKSEYFQRGGVTPFPLTTEVVNESEWTPQVLDQRQKRLINRLKSEWSLG